MQSDCWRPDGGTLWSVKGNVGMYRSWELLQELETGQDGDIEVRGHDEYALGLREVDQVG